MKTLLLDRVRCYQGRGEETCWLMRIKLWRTEAGWMICQVERVVASIAIDCTILIKVSRVMLFSIISFFVSMAL